MGMIHHSSPKASHNKRNGIFLFTSWFEATVTMSPQHGSLSPWLTPRWLPVWLASQSIEESGPEAEQGGTDNKLITRWEVRPGGLFFFLFLFLLTLGKLAAYLPKLSTKLLYLTQFPSTCKIKPVADERLDFTCVFCDLHHLHDSILHCGCNDLYSTNPNVLSYHCYNLLLRLFHQFQLKHSTTFSWPSPTWEARRRSGWHRCPTARRNWVREGLSVRSLHVFLVSVGNPASSNNPKSFKVSLYISSVKNCWLVILRKRISCYRWWMHIPKVVLSMLQQTHIANCGNTFIKNKVHPVGAHFFKWFDWTNWVALSAPSPMFVLALRKKAFYLRVIAATLFLVCYNTHDGSDGVAQVRPRQNVTPSAVRVRSLPDL